MDITCAFYTERSTCTRYALWVIGNTVVKAAGPFVGAFVAPALPMDATAPLYRHPRRLSLGDFTLAGETFTLVARSIVGGLN